MKPSIGRTVIYRKACDPGQPRPPTDRLESPAVVTRVLNDGRVNLHVFFDGESSAIRVSVSQLPPFYPADADWPGVPGWRWPDRV